MSLGWPHDCVNQTGRGEIEDWISHSRVFFRRFLQRAGSGAVWTFSAGNNCMSGPSSPWAANSDLANVIVVAAANSDETLASFSNYDVSIAAPGGVLPTHPNGIDLDSSCLSDDLQVHGVCGVLSSTVLRCGSAYCPARGEMTGTSMAAPVVAGIAALVTSTHPTFTPAQVAGCIESTAGTEGTGSTKPPNGQPGGRYVHPLLPYTGNPIPIVNAGAAVECGGTQTVKATPMGPTSGPAGFGMRVSASSCSYLTVLFDGTIGYIYETSTPSTTFEIVTTPKLTGGTLPDGGHQISFSCRSTPNGGSVLWTSPGFDITITGGPEALTLGSLTVAPGEDLIYTSGPSKSVVARCPPLSGVTLGTLQIYIASSDSLTVPAFRDIAMPDDLEAERLTVPIGTPSGVYTALERCTYSGNNRLGIFEFDFTFHNVTVTGGSSAAQVTRAWSNVAARRQAHRIPVPLGANSRSFAVPTHD
jgi:hypothetical protein